MNLLQEERFNHQAEVVSGVLEEECGGMLSAFFRELRKRRKLPGKTCLNSTVAILGKQIYLSVHRNRCNIKFDIYFAVLSGEVAVPCTCNPL